MKKITCLVMVALGLVMLSGPLAGAAEPEPFRWGMTLEEMNQIWAKSGQTDTILREDSTRLKVILPYNPLKAVQGQRGRLSMIFQARKTEGSLSIGRMFGYLYDGKLFCRAELYKDNHAFSTQEMMAKLKKQYPEGKVYRNITGPVPISNFEYLSNEIYVFSNEEGVYYCEPFVLRKAVREVQQGIEAQEAKDIEETRETMRKP